MTTGKESMFPYAWTGGVITELSNDRKRDLAEQKKRCAICGRVDAGERPVTHEKLSGGQICYLCEDCAVEYVLRAEGVRCKYEEPAPVRLLSVTVVASELEYLKLAIQEWADEYDVQLQMEVAR